MKHIIIALNFLLFVLGAGAQQDAQLLALAENIETEEVSNTQPVSMNAALLAVNEGEKNIVAVKVNILDGWHIYAYVPAGGFFIQSKVDLKLPEGLTAKLIEEPDMEIYEADDKILIYKGEIIFFYELSAAIEMTDAQKTEVILNYQPCDKYKCLAPSKISTILSSTEN